MRHVFVFAVLALLAVPAHAEWRAANAEVAEAARNPRVAAVLAEVSAMDAAIVGGDGAGFVARFADDARVNSPFNNIATKAMAARRYASGALTYKSLSRSIEYAGPRRDDEVVLMGVETFVPQPPHPEAGATLRRRFTDVWRRQDGRWLLSLRQATVFTTDPKPFPTPSR